MSLCLTAFPRSCFWCVRSSSGRNFSRTSQNFLPPAARLRACGGFLFACGGPRRAGFMGSNLGRLFWLLHDSSRPTRRTAKARRLRPARGMAPWVSGSHRSVLHGATPPPPPPPPSPPPPPPPPPLAVASACPGHTTLEAVPSKRGRSACRARDTPAASRHRALLLTASLCRVCRVLSKSKKTVM